MRYYSNCYPGNQTAWPDQDTQIFIPMRVQAEWAWMGIVPTTKHTKYAKTLL